MSGGKGKGYRGCIETFSNDIRGMFSNIKTDLALNPITQRFSEMDDYELKKGGRIHFAPFAICLLFLRKNDFTQMFDYRFISSAAILNRSSADTSSLVKIR